MSPSLPDDVLLTSSLDLPSGVADGHVQIAQLLRLRTLQDCDAQGDCPFAPPTSRSIGMPQFPHHASIAPTLLFMLHGMRRIIKVLTKVRRV